jgi:hypothetical protein
MIRSQHPTNNAVLGAPEGMTKDECQALPITLGVYEDGTKSLKSYWKPTPLELEILNKDGYVTLEVLGFQHPPVRIGAEK